MALQYGPKDVGQAVALYGGSMLAFTMFTFGFAESLPTVAIIGGVLGAVTGAIFIGRALKRRRDRQAEAEWAGEVQQIVRTERVAEIGHTAGGLSVPTEAGDGGGLSVSEAGQAQAAVSDGVKAVDGGAGRLDQLRAERVEARQSTRRRGERTSG